MSISEIACTVEALLNHYSWEFDRSLERKEKMRRLRCGFCHCLYKYQVRLNHHVITKHMVELKHLSDSERRSLIILYLEDDRDITYCQFHNEYFNQKKYLSLYIDN